jgi:hypothetical protein
VEQQEGERDGRNDDDDMTIIMTIMTASMLRRKTKSRERKLLGLKELETVKRVD